MIHSHMNIRINIRLIDMNHSLRIVMVHMNHGLRSVMSHANLRLLCVVIHLIPIIVIIVIIVTILRICINNWLRIICLPHIWVYINNRFLVSISHINSPGSSTAAVRPETNTANQSNNQRNKH
jgi:ABC-type transport system involved in Fe-S cluster assembly fused permease/ATPase subunit